MAGRRRRPPLPAIAAPFGQILSRPEEKSKFLGGCLERQFAQNSPADWDFEEKISDEVHNYLRLSINAQSEPTTVEEVSERILALRPRKAPGPDGVSNTVLQRLPERGVLLQADLFNACLGLSYFPRKWHKTTVI